ncbi:C-terminal helicase domain-containing protein [endosymbiont 'TC1' of Trimyema compressum]|uniref:C-terminal helicase domain-containing protein n=1 Tax=endosymbiont 'TC1' of Trimyema compressum TaxID=243899 RepID=UPI00316AD14B
MITPFKAQAQYLRKRMEEKLSEGDFINVGTVHTFQGSERQIILFSSVYGSKESCFFIDNRKSLINAAVSRAKDYFFLFGAIDCLKDSQGSANELLKSYISENSL